MLLTKQKKWSDPLFLLASFSCSFSCVFAFLFSCYAWFVVCFFLSDITNDAVFLAFSLKTFECAFKRFIFSYFNRCQLSHHLSGFNFLLNISQKNHFCQSFSLNYVDKFQTSLYNQSVAGVSMEKIEMEESRNHYDARLIDDMGIKKIISESDAVERFDQKMDEYTLLLIKQEKRRMRLQMHHNPTNWIKKISVKSQVKTFEKDITSFFIDYATNKLNLDTYINKMFKYFAEADKRYQAYREEFKENITEPIYITQHIEALKNAKKLFLNTIFLHPASTILQNVHKTQTFAYPAYLITQISEVIKDDAISRRNSTKFYHIDQITDKALSTEEIRDTTIKKMKPHIRKLYKFFKDQIDKSENPLITGQMLYYIDMISKTYQVNTDSNNPMIQTDAKAKVFACKLATSVMERHFKYFAPNGLFFPVNANVAIEDFKNCSEYSPDGKVKPIGYVKHVHKLGICARPQVQIILTEKEGNLDGKDK